MFIKLTNNICIIGIKGLPFTQIHAHRHLNMFIHQEKSGSNNNK